MTSQPATLETTRLRLRPWRDDDREPFAALNADPEVMRLFPARLTRDESDAMVERMMARTQQHGFCFWPVIVRQTSEFAGFCGLNVTQDIPGLETGTVEIGWRLARRFWGKGYASESALAWRDHAFTALGLTDIVAFAVPENHASTAVMARIGMHHDGAGDFDHPRIPEARPDLKRHVLWRLDQAGWETLNRA